ncbi:MAG: hypothetical protein K0S61_3540 [Anaerocolumna sp.]|nr:hypothetical protein [Anaerocolumna sp.]
MFSGLITNEFIKLFAKKKTYIILLLFVALSGIFVAVNESSENSYLKYNNPSYKLENVNSQIAYQKSYIDEVGANNTYSQEEKDSIISDTQSYLQSLELEKSNLEKEVANYSPDNWKERKYSSR